MTYTNYIQGWKTEEDLNWMYDAARKMDSVLEIGCWKGRGTHALLSGCKGKVVACDSWDAHHYGRPEAKLAEDKDIYMEFQLNVADAPNLEIWRMNSNEAMKTKREFDLIFIDFRPTIVELRHYEKRAKKMLAGYDYEQFKEIIESAIGPVKHQGLIWYKELI